MLGLTWYIYILSSLTCWDEDSGRKIQQGVNLSTSLKFSLHTPTRLTYKLCEKEHQNRTGIGPTKHHHSSWNPLSIAVLCGDRQADNLPSLKLKVAVGRNLRITWFNPAKNIPIRIIMPNFGVNYHGEIRWNHPKQTNKKPYLEDHPR